jgi:ABC-type transport system involved in multi-copper enzyme maturation permease subunit
MTPVSLIARKEAGELMLSLRGLSWLLALTIVLSAFATLLISDAELSLLDNAEVVYDMLGIATGLGCLLALVVGVESVAGERERGSLVSLLIAPVSREEILLGKLGGIAIAWAAMYALTLPYLWAVGSTGQHLARGLLALAVLGTPVVVTFGLFGLALGARLKIARSGILTGLIVLILAASPLLIGPSLRQSAVGRAFDLINPVSAALNAYDALIVDGEPISTQWSFLATALVWLGLTFWWAIGAMRRLVP